jgi:Pyruvate/2-oxoacid:ferredoxin oxidoreductase gamma subunit
MLGAFAAHTEITSKEALIQSLQSTVKEKTLPMNLEAFEAGYAFASETEQKNG